MKIYSSFKDFYDIGLRYGIDQDIKYVRKEEEIPLTSLKWKVPDWVPFIGNPESNGNGDWGFKLIGFCGTIYPYMPVEVPDIGRYTYQVHLYKPEECEEFQAAIMNRRHWLGARKNSFKEIQSLLTNKTVDDKPFVELGCPIFIIEPEDYYSRKIEIKKNPCLKDRQFFKVKDPFTAFREISEYLGNQLVKRSDPDEIEDKYRIVQHGFDKWSFRRHKDDRLK